MKPAIRLAQETDALQMLAIYAPIVRETAISFELEPPSEQEFRDRIQHYLQRLPWLVCELGGEILGYAYSSSHRSRGAYQWSVESSVYVAARHQRKGVGRALYTSLFEALRLQGFYNVFAGIRLPNPVSVAMHEAVGFSFVGVYRNIGYKLGRWHDVGWWQLSLQSQSFQPIHPPVAWQEVSNLTSWQTALDSGLSWLRV